MLSLLVWLRMHPVTLIIGYGASCGWFDGLFAALPEETWTMRQHASDLLYQKFFGAGLSQKALDAGGQFAGIESPSYERLLESSDTNSNVTKECKVARACKPSTSSQFQDDIPFVNEIFFCFVGNGETGMARVGMCGTGGKDVDSCESLCEGNHKSMVDMAKQRGLDETAIVFGCMTKEDMIAAEAKDDCPASKAACPSDCSGCWNNKDHPTTCLNAETGFPNADQGYCDASSGTWCQAGNKEDEKEDEEEMDQMVFYGVLGSAGFLVLSVLASVFYTLEYKSKVTDKRPPLPSVESGTLDSHLIIMSDGRFKYGLCDNWCWSDCDMCINTTCCLATRIADTHSTAGTGKSFWFLFWVFEVIFILEQIINAVEGFAEDPITAAPMDWNPGWIVSGILHCLIMVNLRQVLRQKFGGPKSNCCFDCAIWFCCPLCAACQESKQVDEAQGSKVKCCCNLQIVGDPMVAKPVTLPVQAQAVIVGQAVKAEPVVQAQPVMEGQPVEANVQSDEAKKV